MSDLARQIITIVAVTVTLIVNGLANALPLNGQTTGSISDRFDVYFVPAGYVFAIWGLIYLLLIAYAVTRPGRASARTPTCVGSSRGSC